MTLTTLPPNPTDRSDRSLFDTEATALFTSLYTFVSEMNALIASLNLGDTDSTSATSIAMASGPVYPTVQTNKSYLKGMSVKIASTANPTIWMHGDVLDYIPGTGELAVNVTNYAGSGTYAAWTITLSAPVNTDLGLWKQTSGTFTATPASTSTLTMTVDMTALIKPRMSLKYVIGGTTYYGIVGAITSNLLTIWGAPLSGDVTALYYGGGRTRQVQVIIPGYYEDATSTGLIAADIMSSFVWSLPVSYLVHYKVYSDVVDTGTKGTASVRINATEVNTVAGGLTLTAAKTWYSTEVDIAVAAYDINPGEVIEVTAVKNGNGDATDLTVEMIFVTP